MTVTARELLEAMGERLALRLVAGARGVDRAIAVPRVQQPGLALAGFLPQLHPDRIQVLGNSEIAYLQTLDAAGPLRLTDLRPIGPRQAFSAARAFAFAARQMLPRPFR